MSLADGGNAETAAATQTSEKMKIKILANLSKNISSHNLH